MEDKIVGVWAVTELVHSFASKLGRIDAREFKNDQTGTSFADMRFVFNEDGRYCVYSDALCTNLCHDGKWYEIEGRYYYDPIISEPLPPAIAEETRLLRFENGEITVNLVLLSLFLKKIG